MSNIGAQWSYPFGQSYLRVTVYCSDSTENLFKVILKKFIKISLTYLLFDLFCDNNNYSIPHPPPLHTEIQKYKLL